MINTHSQNGSNGSIKAGYQAKTEWSQNLRSLNELTARDYSIIFVVLWSVLAEKFSVAVQTREREKLRFLESRTEACNFSKPHKTCSKLVRLIGVEERAIVLGGNQKGVIDESLKKQLDDADCDGLKHSEECALRLLLINQ